MDIPKVPYSGSIKEIKVGKEGQQKAVGGETCYPFHLFEGQVKNAPLLALEITDVVPENWPEAVKKPYADVLDKPADWAQKCVKDF